MVSNDDFKVRQQRVMLCNRITGSIKSGLK